MTKSVLTDQEIQDIADGFDIYGAKPEFARAIASAVLSKLRAGREPIGWIDINQLREMGDAWVYQCEPGHVAEPGEIPVFTAPQASAEESAIDKPIPDSVEHYGLIDERVGAPAASAEPREVDMDEYRAMVAAMEQIDPATLPGLTAAQRCALGRFAKPAGRPAGDAKDAERYRWLRDGGINELPYDDHGAGPEFDLSESAIDAAMAQQRQGM